MKHLRRLGLLVAALFIVGSSLGLALPVLVQQAAASTVGSCKAPSIMFGRWKWCGYFYNKFEDSGTNVRAAGVPGSVNTVQTFISLVEGDLTSGDTHRNTEAAFVILTMIGAPLPPPLPNGAPKVVTAAQKLDFEQRMTSYGDIGQNGSTSTGVNGHITWFYSDYMHCGDYNSYYQQTWHDIAPYVISKSNTPECDNSGVRFDHIVIYDTAGNVLWRIRRLCMNPLGTINPLKPKPADFNLTPNINLTQNGAPLPNGSYVDAGSSVKFDYSVGNSTSTTATGIACNIYANTYTGFHAIPAPPDSSGPAPPGPACTDTFPPGNTSLGSETVNNLAGNSSYCRSLYVNPNKPTGGGPLGYESCVYVTNKPYFRVYGGDVTAGNAQPGSCAITNNAAIVGWNKEAGGGYGGAGVQYAALALHNIYDFATNLGNAASGVTTPSGLAFANTTASGSSIFGGSIGSLNNSCIPDYYGTPTGPSPGNNVNIGTLPNGTYTATGPLTIIASTLAAGKQVRIYVNGDVVINGSIGYSGASDSAHIPLLQIVAKGNIYIDGGVTNLDGVYIAQGLAAGTIYTCAAGTTPVAPTASGYFDTCKNRLVVNGAFVARQVQLLRTNGSVGASSAGEANSSSNIGEVFNYGPAFWIPQPAGGATSGDYDSITSLPPIL